MTNKNHIIQNFITNLTGKSIIISSEGYEIQGKLLNYKSSQYYYDLVLKCGRYKKKISVFYPFDVQIENGQLVLDYRLSKLKSELMYNITRKGDEHPFLDNLVTIHET